MAVTDGWHEHGRGHAAERRRRTTRRLGRAVVVCVATLVGVLTATAALAVPFPVDESFGGASTENPAWKLSGSASLTNEGAGWLRLTPALNTQAGSALLDDAFSSSLGIVIDFEYATWGGSGGDGFSLFLIDGSGTTGPGARGGSLGYSCAPDTAGPFVGVCRTTPGVTGGIVGIGFDEFGNFSGSVGGPGVSPGQRPNSVALRGSGSGTSGYQYLTGATVTGGVATGSRAGARHVRITIIDAKITVELTTATGTQKVIDAFDLTLAPNQAPIPPTLKLGLSSSTGAANNVHEIRNLTVAAPVDLAVTTTAPAEVSPGGSYSGRLQVTNAGPNAANGASVRAVVPSAVTDVAAGCTAAGGAVCATAPAIAGNVVTLTVDVPVGGAVTVDLSGRTRDDAAPGSSITTTGSVAPPAIETDIAPANDTSSATTAVKAAAVTTTTTSTTTPATTTTTAAPAPPPDDELPRTGSTSPILPGAALLGLAVAVLAGRRRLSRA